MSFRHLTVIATVCVVGFAAAAARAQHPNITTVIDVPGSPVWGNICGMAANVPGGASQLSPCNPFTGTCLLRTTLPTNTFPNAVCNDGSPGVFYVRPGSGADVDKWIIHTQGGGSCKTYDDCLERWCGQQGALPYTANKMSTDWDDDGVVDLPLHGKVKGMSDYANLNDFKDWTHVWAYYCSSDTWLGRASDVDYNGANSFSIHQRGHTILSAMRRMLRKNNANPLWKTDDGTVVPDLDDATDVVFTGTSAGAKGAIQNVDWFMRPLAAPNKYLILDGNLDMSDDVLLANDIWIDLNGDGSGDSRYYSERITMSLDSWSTGWNHAVDAFVDESCRSFYEPLGRLDRCSFFSTLLWLKLGGVPLIETETFIRVDLEDGVINKRWRGTWPTGERLMVGQLGRATTEDDFTALMRETLEQLYNDPVNKVSGVFAPRCGQHVGLENGLAYADHNTPDTTSTPWSSVGLAKTAHQAIWDWYTNPGPGHRTLDTGDVGDPILPNNPITDPVTQFSAGTGCQY